jgi:hypothetical protein
VTQKPYPKIHIRLAASYTASAPYPRSFSNYRFNYSLSLSL